MRQNNCLLNTRCSLLLQISELPCALMHLSYIQCSAAILFTAWHRRKATQISPYARLPMHCLWLLVFNVMLLFHWRRVAWSQYQTKKDASTAMARERLTNSTVSTAPACCS